MRIIQAVAVFGLIASPMALAACDTNEGPFEEAGEELDEAGDDIEDAVD
jgi:predicted small secreted protein